MTFDYGPWKFGFRILFGESARLEIETWEFGDAGFDILGMIHGDLNTEITTYTQS